MSQLVNNKADTCTKTLLKKRRAGNMEEILTLLHDIMEAIEKNPSKAPNAFSIKTAKGAPSYAYQVNSFTNNPFWVEAGSGSLLIKQGKGRLRDCCFAEVDLYSLPPRVSKYVIAELQRFKKYRLRG